jgi:hypothetical protein
LESPSFNIDTSIAEIISYAIEPWKKHFSGSELFR